VYVVMNLPDLYNAGNFLTSLEPVGFSRRTLLRIVSINFRHAVFSHLSIHDDLAMQALVWF